jgi:hypothetical protein
MSNKARATRRIAVHPSHHEDFHNIPKHLWDQEVVRIIRASRGSQRRLAEWSAELTKF